MSSKEKEVVIFDIQRYSLHDGLGLRTVVFFKGCPLRCMWCSNPESQESKKEVFVSELNCIGCGTCVEVCPKGALSLDASKVPTLDRAKCDLCGDCVRACPSAALRFFGEVYDLEGVMKVIRRDVPFYRCSGGGVTISGGEPLQQWQFAKALLEACNLEGIDTAMETCGFAPWKNLEVLLPLLGQVFYDIKHVNRERHLVGTGQDCTMILENLKKLVTIHPNVVIRVPVIPGFNADREDMDRITEWISVNAGNIPVELMAYHRYGEKKYDSLGRPYPLKGFPLVSQEEMDDLKALFEEKGISCRQIN